ncbi:hypothetical protein Mal52_43450 [Symmachiella dynata]|uniref:ABC-2 family transporter protein n=1 Tax=Symmachiella dynata TaxID=2527995 RepID=A0A517ZTP7_9PLAN|nr:ABC transporter permease [Symmachiella dynata]QDU45849.1 hypothetical protein Mal52_43450 [Symmachiella dynata]
MLRPTFALMNRSLRLDVRRRRFHLLRLIVVSVLFVLLLMAQGRSWSLAAPGLSFFRTIAWLNISLIAISGIGFFASAITEEKEEMTLELFMIAGIGPLAIMIGKGVNRLTAALSVLVVQIPFTMIAVTLGGVKARQILAAYVALAAFLFLVANIGLFYSVLCRRTGHAMAYTVITIGLLLNGPALIGKFMTALIARGFLTSGGTIAQSATTLSQVLHDASITTRMDAILQTAFNSPAIGFQVQSNLAAGVGLFVTAWLLFNWFNAGVSHSAPSRGWVSRPDRLLRFLAPARPWKNALAWKDFHFLTGGKMLILVRLLLIPLLTLGVYFSQLVANTWGNWWDLNMQNLVGVSLVVLAAELLVQSSRIFHEEVKWKTLGNIALLPQPIGASARDKLRGCLLGCIPAILWLSIGIAGSHYEILRNLYGLSEGMWFVCGLAEFVLFLHITAYLSLVVRWGALPLAVVVFATYVALSMSCLAAMLAGLLINGSETGSAAMAAYNAIAATIVSGLLYAAIGRRLETAQGL